MHNSQSIPLNRIYPSIKSYDWIAADKNRYHESLYTGPGIPDKSPVIAYAIDQGGKLAFLMEETLAAPQFPDVRFSAQKNLEAKLSHLAWRQEVHERQWDFEGDYYASEGLLSKKIMNQAHDVMQATRLAAATPRRGELIVLSLDGTSQSEIESFVDTVLKRYFLAKHTGSPESISPIIWMVESGEIKGFMKLSSEYMTYWDKTIRNALTDN